MARTIRSSFHTIICWRNPHEVPLTNIACGHQVRFGGLLEAFRLSSTRDSGRQTAHIKPRSLWPVIHWISQWGTVRDEHLYYHSNQFHISRVPDTCLLIFCWGGGCLKCRKFVYFSLSLSMCMPRTDRVQQRKFQLKGTRETFFKKSHEKNHLAGLIEQSHAMPCYTYHQV